MSKGSGVSRSDRRRNARKERLRDLLPRDGAVIGIDLGEDKQALAVVDHDVRVRWRKTVKVKAFRLGEALDQAVAAARLAGFAQVTVACEPTGARWMQVQRLCGERGLPLVCIQPLMSHVSREQQELDTHKTDESDCVMIGRLATELHCYIPEVLDEAWGYLRQLGRRREQLVRAAVASGHRIRDFLASAWPVVLETCADPLKSRTWLAAVQLVTGRCGADPGQLAVAGPQEFAALVRAAAPGWAARWDCRAITLRIFAALTSTEGAVAWSRRGLLRRVADELGDLQRTRAQLRAVEADMVAVLDELGLSRLAGIPALTALGAAVILAETGDPHRYDSSSSLVKHAGLAPASNESGAFAGDAHISRRGRPGLRRAVWRMVWPMLQFNPVLAAKYQAMTQAAGDAARQAPAGTRQATAAAAAARRQRARARVACAASLLRWIYCLTVHGTSWDPAIAAAPAAQPSPAPAQAA
jgi:transposase